ncbi:IPExxxVDY family protein [Flavobacterium sp. xlx-214]|uniref:IPExxxVDY family protein n=1 Tax=unclassified Flavobacterium TaxID=196869 RepID=UPI0013D7CBDC|nr:MULTISPECIES: IPExxxVDY family protein [unclassified Flavobacterium]MBA5793069.1 IPExxxVDY family protein [Flavobacterium sp. xlx-221]QMI84603.1 IPExxxVDY family protein [Flavobacterium sp. xlx-214]
MVPIKKNTNEILHKLDYDDTDYEEILLIAIQSNMPDYKMAYHLNKNLNIQFQKVHPEITLTSENGVTYLRHFLYEDCKNHLNWRLIENKSNYSISQLDKKESLFVDPNDLFSTTEYLVPEWKTIDYFLQIENADDFFQMDEIENQLNKIKNISMYFVVDIESLSAKSKKNILF